MFKGYELTTEECEYLGRILMRAQRVYHRHQFFEWVHGPVQALIPHETLLCGLIDIRGGIRHECFSSCRDFDAGRHRQAVDPDSGLIPALSRAWISLEEPVLIDEVQYGTGNWVERLGRLALTNVAFHGIRGPGGMLAYAGFAQVGVPMNESLARHLELLMPQLAVSLARMLATEGHRRLPAWQGPAGLTAREIEVLDWVKFGKTNGEIAEILGLSMPTVKNHLQHAMKKLAVRTRGQALARAIALGFVQV